MPGSWAQRDFPHLNTGTCQVTSPATNAYNCIAWAAGNDKRWWDPDSLYYWPKGVPREVSLDAVLQVYERLGFAICVGGELETGLDKIAIFVKEIPLTKYRRTRRDNWSPENGPVNWGHSKISLINPWMRYAVHLMARSSTSCLAAGKPLRKRPERRPTFTRLP